VAAAINNFALTKFLWLLRCVV